MPFHVTCCRRCVVDHAYIIAEDELLNQLLSYTAEVQRDLFEMTFSFHSISEDKNLPRVYNEFLRGDDSCFLT